MATRQSYLLAYRNNYDFVMLFYRSLVEMPIKLHKKPKNSKVNFKVK